jgi:hypothetical protein
MLIITITQSNKTLTLLALCNLFGKLFAAQAGKVLAVYGNPGQDVAYPNLSVIFDSEETTQLLSNMAISLFSILSK